MEPVPTRGPSDTSSIIAGRSCRRWQAGVRGAFQLASCKSRKCADLAWSSLPHHLRNPNPNSASHKMHMVEGGDQVRLCLQHRAAMGVAKRCWSREQWRPQNRAGPGLGGAPRKARMLPANEHT